MNRARPALDGGEQTRQAEQVEALPARLAAVSIQERRSGTEAAPRCFPHYLHAYTLLC